MGKRVSDREGVANRNRWNLMFLKEKQEMMQKYWKGAVEGMAEDPEGQVLGWGGALLSFSLLLEAWHSRQRWRHPH